MKKLIKLDLRLFDDVINSTNSPSLSAEMKTFYCGTLIDNAEPELIHDQFGDEKDIPKNGGKSVEFRKYEALQKAMKPLEEGITPVGNQLSVSTITATVDQYGDYIKLTDMLELTAIDNNIIEATQALGSQAGRTLDSVTRDVLAGGTSVMYQPKSDGTKITSRKDLDSTCKITSTTINKCATFLKKQHAQKFDGSYVAIIHPDVSEDLRESEGWLDVHKYAKPEEIYEGEIGKLHGIRFVENSEAKIWKDETCPTDLAVYSTLIMGRHAYGKTKVTGGGLEVIVKPKGSGEDPLNQRSTVGWKAIKTAERLVEQYMIRIESISSYSETAEAN